MTERDDWNLDFEVKKLDEDRHLVFGWAYVPYPAQKSAEKPKIDQQGHYIELDDLELAAYEYVELYGEGDDMHTEPVRAKLVESMVFTPEKMEKMGVEWNGPWAWWTGYHVDDESWELVKSGERSMFSIFGTAQLVEE